MKTVDIKLNESLVKNLSTTNQWVEITALLSVNQSDQSMVSRLSVELPRDMCLAFFKQIRLSQQQKTSVFANDPTDFIQVTRIVDYEPTERKMLNFFRTIWQNMHQVKSHRSLKPKAQQLEEIRNLRIRL
ncbi:hypothetical protein CL622_00995 [archaeon]|nr:hypothetical protein [archaeon]